jgi:LmbE family N-acetylglucosaminyl deacetylase
MHLFLSPHLDDAILSCGGLIHQLVGDGEQVLIRTIMAGDPPLPFPDTPLIRDLHQRWEADESPMLMRRVEDSRAAQSLGAEVEYLSLLDCPYRTDTAGTPLYQTNDALFGNVHPHDPALGLIINVPKNVKHIYAPLGAGGHVDHKVVCQLSQTLSTVSFYEEYPYGANSGEAVRVTYNSGVQKYGTEAVQIALAAFPRPLQSTVIHMATTDIDAKINAVACYQSQMSTFWDDVADMAAGIHRYAQEVGGGERLWIYEEK